MDFKYILYANSEDGKISWVGVNSENGDMAIERINQNSNPEEYKSELLKINQKYGGDFFSSIQNKKVKFVKESFFIEKSSQRLDDDENTDKLRFIITNEKELTAANSLDAILKEVHRNSLLIDEDNALTPQNIASRIVDWSRAFKQYYKIGTGVHPDIDIKFFFPKVVDANMKHVSDEKAREIEASIVKVSARLNTTQTLFFDEPVMQFLSHSIKGYVDFQSFVHNLEESGYVLADSYFDRKISNLYNEDGTLELFSLKEKQEYQSGDFCYHARFIERERLIQEEKSEGTNKGLSR